MCHTVALPLRDAVHEVGTVHGQFMNIHEPLINSSAAGFMNYVLEMSMNCFEEHLMNILGILVIFMKYP